MFLEGARWSSEEKSLTLSNPKELFSNLPLIKLQAVQDKLYVDPLKSEDKGIYKCPLYRVVSRAGTLMTTGHSTNFVLFIDIPTPLYDS